MEKQERYKRYQPLVPQHNNDKFFKKRSEKLDQIKSYHFFKMRKSILSQSPQVEYQQSIKYTLDGLNAADVQLLPSHIRTIIWQITKLMLECQRHQINHLQLYSKSIVLKNKYQPKSDTNIFLQVTGFSFGKTFAQVSQGKLLEYFQYLHPDISIENKTFDFEMYNPSWDIWSMGIILYKLIYKKNPFYKTGKSIYSKTILREYLKNQYEVNYHNNKFDSINKFIQKCLSIDSRERFDSWTSIKDYIINEEEIYNLIDFHDRKFYQMAQIHIKLMTFFSCLYCMIIDQCRDSPNKFWKIMISQTDNVPFQLQIAEFTLFLMRIINNRFAKTYSSHYFLLDQKTKRLLIDISENIEEEFSHKKEWIVPKFKSTSLSLQIIRCIEPIICKFKIEQEDTYFERQGLIQLFDSRKITKKNVPEEPKRGSTSERKVWKSTQTLIDYVEEVRVILNNNKTRSKKIFQLFYINRMFQSICNEDFRYARDIDLAYVFKKIYGS